MDFSARIAPFHRPRHRLTLAVLLLGFVLADRIATLAEGKLYHERVVLTHYRATNDRWQTFATEWAVWRDRIISELSTPHPDLAEKTTRIDITRYGHAMAIPVPHPEGKIGLHSFRNPVITHERLSFAHSDWAGYSIFEEAFTMGHRAGWA